MYMHINVEWKACGDRLGVMDSDALLVPGLGELLSSPHIAAAVAGRMSRSPSPPYSQPGSSSAFPCVSAPLKEREAGSE